MKAIIIIFTVLLTGCMHYTGKNTIVKTHNQIETLILGDWNLDSTTTNDKITKPKSDIVYAFDNGKFFKVEKGKISMSKYKISGKTINLFTRKGKCIDEASILKITPLHLIIRSTYYPWDKKTLYLSR